MQKLSAIVKNHPVKIFFLLSTLLGYAQWIFTGTPNWFIYGMLLSGLFLTAVLDGKQGILDQLKSATRFKTSLTHYLTVLLLLLAANGITITLAYLLYGDRPSLAMIRTEPHLIPVLALFVLAGGPIAEELFGLRGFALPRLLNRYNPLVSSLIVGFYFGAWHLIEFFRPGSSQYAIGLGFYPLFIVSEIAHSIMMTWIYLRSGRNLFVAGIFYHLTMNMMAVLFQSDVTFSSVNAFPEINRHYFVIYSLVTIGFAVGIALYAKLYQPINASHPLTGA
ncbi:MAG: CPBP family intramembrane glutamic endopeptidase [Anaerolineaceae bacterium]|jgi:membrane protease YdiL (CAAX protease family)|nr:CPBP family intramembrane glutamic endopeptidase [Anaerolineaceae bacterium]